MTTLIKKLLIATLVITSYLHYVHAAKDVKQGDVKAEQVDLFKLIDDNKNDELENELKGGADANQLYKDNGWTLLHYAAVGRKWKAVEILIEYGADPNKIDHFGRTPETLARGRYKSKDNEEKFQNARKRGLEVREQRLAAAKKDVKQGDVKAEQVDLFKLIENVKNFKPAELEKQLKAGADVNQKHPSIRRGTWTLLHEAAYDGNYDAVEILITYGADPIAMTADKQTPADVLQGSIEGYEERVQKGLAKRKQREEAAQDERVLQALLKQDAEKRKKQGVVQDIKDTPVDIKDQSLKAQMQKMQPQLLHEVEEPIDESVIDIVRDFKEFDAFRQDIIRAVSSKVKPVASGVYDDLKDLTSAVGSLVTPKQLGQILKSSIPQCSQIITQLHLLNSAAFKATIELMTILIAAGANLSQGDENEVTPLHEAARSGSAAAVNLLTQALLNPKNKWGETPLEITQKNKSVDAAAVLMGAQVGAHAGKKMEEQKAPKFASKEVKDLKQQEVKKEEKVECPICLEEYFDRELMPLGCHPSHKVCKKCYEDETLLLCPICRKPIEAKQKK